MRTEEKEILYHLPLYFTCEICKREVHHLLSCLTRVRTDLRPLDPLYYKLTCKKCWRKNDKFFLKKIYTNLFTL